MTDVNFDQEKELEGELFRLGMKFDEIHEKVDENMKEKSSQRQPFQANQASTSTGNNVENGDLDGRAIDQMKRKMKGTKAGDDLLQPREDDKLNQGLARLHDEYNALMDRYRRLKQMAQTPERDQEIDNLKLRHICDEEPDVFKMPRELQERPSSRASSVASNRSSRSNREDRPPSRGSIKGGNQRDQGGQTRDYTDDSYTLTESDMSFEADNRPRKNRSSLKARRSPGVIEHTIEEEDEDVTVSLSTAADESAEIKQLTGVDIHSGQLKHLRQRQVQRSPPQEKMSKNRQKEVQRGDKIMTPRKQSSKLQTNVSASSGSVFLEDDDLTPRQTPNQSFNETRELFSSEDEPRQVQSQSVQRLEAQKAATVSRSSGDGHRPPTPGSKIEHRPPTPRVTTPVKSRRELEDERKIFEDRAVGSDSDDTLQGSEHGTAATRGSNASSQFRMLQDEIGRLREEFQRATQQQQQVPQQIIQPPPPPQATNNERDYFFDPTEDPYAFMQGPRRRANSFSGAVTRDYDDWWKYPLQNPHNEDIPLGYAAADSYATPRIVSTERAQETPSRARRRERLRNRYRRTAEHEAQTANGYDSDQSPTRLPAATNTMTDEQLMDYYVPRYTTTQTQQSNIDQQVPQTHYTSPAPVRLVQRYSSQPNLSQNTRRPTAASQPQGAYASTPQYQNIPMTSYQTTSRPQRRFQRRSIYRTPNSTSQRQYSQDDIDVQSYQPVTYVLADQVPVEGQGHAINGQVYTETSTCPMCGGSGYHTHGDYVHEVPVSGPVYVLESPQS
ncbi:hypothetical protein KUTeg_001139 [Tegillarca granosa]|uniref:Uncharacterized protein n=1 Tax=Tegillarca granosa TaxID=220873 RepID=A0ABQ9FYU1_TEGGR|nr:hypothetical protein KUTeg_001139 [Tegillarca granosa]